MANVDPAHLLARWQALPAAQPLLRRLRGYDDDLYLVGGAVRDLILGGEPLDFDLVVSGPVDAVAERLDAPVRTHDRFGTASTEVEGFRYDLAQARTETYVDPGALPTVTPATLDQDLARRDFTVNAIALGVAGEASGRLAAADAALSDLAAGRLRVLHDASFVDDPTRLLRLARYGARLGFAPEPHTLSLVERATTAGALDTVSGARIGAELRLLAVEADPLAGIRTLTDLGVAGAVASGLGLDAGRAAVAERGLELLPADGHAGMLVLAAAALDIGPDALAPLWDRLGFTAAERDRLLAAAAAPQLARALQTAESASAVAAAARGAPPEAVALAGALGAEPSARRWLDELRTVKLGISGSDLLAAGIPSGPRIGTGLRAALAAKLDGRAPDRATELAVALGAGADK